MTDPTAPVQDDDPLNVVMLSSICGAHFNEDCRACQSAKASNDERLSRLSPTPETGLEPGSYFEAMKAAADEIARLKASETALRQIAERLVDQQDEPWPLGTEADRLHYWRDKAINAAREIESLSNVSRLED
jgi:hypothetical protein